MKTNNKNIISEELFAAFEEGKTNAEETMRVINALAGDEDLQKEYIISKQLDAMMGFDEEQIDILPINAMAAECANNLCDFQCEQYVLNRRNISYDSTDLSEEAKSNRWLYDKGTPLHSVGRLLEQRDLIVLRRYGAEVEDLKRAIDANQDIITIVNNNTLTGVVSDNIAYHAVVVERITDKEVELYNPAIGEESVLYPRDKFESAWKEAKSYTARVKGKDFDYNPHPIDLDDVELSTDLLDLREAIAENAHEVWADQRQEEGWIYGPMRDDQRKLHPDMLPYTQLPESEKEYDRRMAFDTIKLMKKLGYDIIKHEDTSVHMELLRKLQHEDSARVCECGATIFPDQIYCSHCGEKLDWKKFV